MYVRYKENVLLLHSLIEGNVAQELIYCKGNFFCQICKNSKNNKKSLSLLFHKHHDKYLEFCRRLTQHIYSNKINHIKVDENPLFQFS